MCVLTQVVFLGFRQWEDLGFRDLTKCTESPNEIVGKNVRGMSSVESSCVMSIIPGQSEASLVQMFFYAANKAVIVNEADFWEKSYLLRQKLLVQLLQQELFLQVIQHAPMMFLWASGVTVLLQSIASVTGQWSNTPKFSGFFSPECDGRKDDSPTFCPPTIIRAQTPSSVVPNIVHTGPSSASNRHGFIKLSQLPPDSPQRPSSSELLAFSESIKSKFSAASASSVLFCSAVLVRLFSVLLLFCCVPYNGFVLFCCCCYPMAVMAAVSC
ncbi:hypothetical protein RHMOL_Rhmol04G0094800 [Rhododendron molle]|uniref:Uncharacterized protein n=2 Tax=Rhododendron molle TaxID=49168 RepID=A0ACC0NYJ7_RHOML|nr:hypothetical protein RHMOL_Rhmol04G0094800 [Rhododendron molle]